MHLRELVKNVYFNDRELTNEDYAYSRKMFLYESSSANAAVAICGGAFLAGFNNYLGVSDEVSGIIAGIPILTGVVQIFSPIIFEKIEKKKFLICLSYLLNRILLGFMYLIPLMVTGTAHRIILMLSMYILSSAFSSFAAAPVGGWIVDLAPTQIRGIYLGKKDAVSLITNTVTGLTMGWILDLFRAANQERLGFIFIGCVVLMISIANFIFMSKVHEPLNKKSNDTIRIRDVIVKPFQDTNFRKVIIFTVLYNIALQISAPYFSIYMVTGLKLNYGYITMIGILSTATRVFFSKRWGKLADRTSWHKVTILSIFALGLNHCIWIVINPSTASISFPLVQLISGATWAGAAISVFNLPFMYLPEQGRTMYLSSNAAYGALAGFLSTLVGSRILASLKGYNFSILSLNIGNMQLLFAISGVLLVACALYVLFFMKPEKKID
jgi:Na+/melibiose symporter-like transporter